MSDVFDFFLIWRIFWRSCQLQKAVILRQKTNGTTRNLCASIFVSVMRAWPNQSSG